jgi:peptide/nickel transport system ATP-binding protein
LSVLLDVSGLHVGYESDPRPVQAVVDVSFQLHRGETLGVAGESGSGKTTLINAITRLQRPPAVTTAGTALFHTADGRTVDLLRADRAELQKARWDEVSVVFQSAMNALNPVLRLGDQFVDVLRVHRGITRAQAEERAADLLRMVGIPGDRLRAYPHEMSGGMRQRATIALALACEPELVVMDEPTTAVDVVMQRQILRQVTRLQAELGFAIVFITHDLSLLIEIADRIAVMYAGRIVEMGPARRLYTDPVHPYSAGLRDSFPPLHGPVRPLTGIPGSPPDLRNLPPGCAFHDRCARRFDPCGTVRPELVPIGDREVACHLPDPALAAVGNPPSTTEGAVDD